MKKLTFTIDIRATKEKVWNVLWEDKTFREWSNLIDEGTYIVGELKEGNEVQFLSASGYGVTSYVEKFEPREYALLRHMSDTQDNGKRERPNEWTGGSESYTLTQTGDTTSLEVEFDIPLEQEELFNVIFPKAMERIKLLAER